MEAGVAKGSFGGNFWGKFQAINESAGRGWLAGVVALVAFVNWWV